MHKRRDFLAGSISLLLSGSLTRSGVRRLRASVHKKEEGGRRSELFVGGPNAADSNPGTAAAPFATIQAAANVAAPGAEVRIRDGVYRETVTPANSGTEEDPIIFMADTRTDGSLCEPVISGAELIADNAWTLTAVADDAVLGGTGCYHADITLPSDSIEALDPKVNIGGDDVIISNQIFCKSDQVHLAAFPKKQVPYDLLDIRNYRDQAYLVDTNQGAKTFLNGCTIKRINTGGVDTIRWRELDMPDVDYTGAFVWCNVNYLPFSSPVSNWGSDGDYRYLDLEVRNPDYRIVVGEFSGWEGRHAHSLTVLGAKGLLTGSNEWFYEPGRLFIRPPISEPPSGVEYKARNWGFNLTGKSHIVLNHLNFFACEIPCNGDLATPSQTEGIVIDYCRFKYLNWWETKRDRGGAQNELDDRVLAWPMAVLRSSQNPYNMQTGIRLTAANSMIRNSVIRQAAGDGVYLSGVNCRVENNWFSDIGIRGGYSAPINTAVPNPAVITRNTVRRAYRSALNHIGYDKEISYNDFGHCMCLSNDGGTIYSVGRWEKPLDGSGGPGSVVGGSGTDGGAYRGTVIHHNWIHSVRIRNRRSRPAGVDSGSGGGSVNNCSGLYFDGSSDGAIVHHNVFWDNVAIDTMPGINNTTALPPHQGVTLEPDGTLPAWAAVWAGKFNRYYNNTFASPAATVGLDHVNGVNRSTSIRSGQYARNPDTVDNNIYLRDHLQPIVSQMLYPVDPEGDLPGYRIRDSEVGAMPPTGGVQGALGIGNSRVPVFVNPGSPHERFERYRPGDPLTVGGLRFQLQPGSPGIGIGNPIDGTLDNGKPPQINPDGSPLVGGYPEVVPVPITGLDEFNSQGGIDAGAYQTGVTPWVAGCDLSDEFIEGEPWKNQWDV